MCTQIPNNQSQQIQNDSENLFNVFDLGYWVNKMQPFKQFGIKSIVAKTGDSTFYIGNFSKQNCIAFWQILMQYI